MSIAPAPDLTASLSRFTTNVWAHAALGAAVELGLLDELETPRTVDELSGALSVESSVGEALFDVLVQTGALEHGGGLLRAAGGLEPFLREPLKDVLTAELRSERLQTADLVERARLGGLRGGWDHTDDDLLDAQGETGRLFRMAMSFMLPQLDGLVAALERPGAAFLDVGAGVGVLSIELCRAFADARAVALEPHAPALRLGESKVAAAGLADRIEFRDELVQDLADRDAFDLAYVPQAFIPPDAFEAGLDRVLAALRPGGWLICLSLDLAGADALESSVRRLKARLWGGDELPEEDIHAQLERAGFVELRPNPPLGAYRTVAARRPAGAQEGTGNAARRA